MSSKTQLQTAMANVDLQENAERKMNEALSDISDAELETALSTVRRKPAHLISTMAKAQRNLLDKAVNDLAEMEAKRNVAEGEIDNYYNGLIEAREADRTKLFEMMKVLEADLGSLKTERREKKLRNQSEFEADRAAQMKIIESLRTLVNSLES